MLSDADLPIVAEIVRRLDGLPLALELAAGRTTSLSVGDLRDRLGRALDLLEAGRASTELRHRTLRSTIEWSYRLLAAPEQRLLRALAQLPSGFGLDAAEHFGATLAVEGDPAGHLARLVDASVVAREHSPVGSRYLLLETVRAFALEELTAHEEQEAAARALVSYGVSLARRLGRELCGPEEAAADARLRRELPNLRVAFRAALAQGVLEAAVDIVVDLDEAALWRVMPDLHDWAMELATRPDVSALPRAAEVLGTAARAAWQRGELDAAQRLVDDAMRLATNDIEATRAIDVTGTLALFGGDLELARERYLAAAVGRPDYASLPTSAALAAIYAGDRQEAERLLQRAEHLAGEGRSLTDRAFNLYRAASSRPSTIPSRRSRPTARPSSWPGRAEPASSRGSPRSGWSGCGPPPARSTRHCTGSAGCSSTGAARGAGSSNGPPCATSRICSSTPATTTPPRCCWPRPTRPLSRPRSPATRSSSRPG